MRVAAQGPDCAQLRVPNPAAGASTLLSNLGNGKTMKTSLRFLVVLVAATTFPIMSRANSAPQNWKSLCAGCHASDGSGKTRIGLKLHAKDYTTAAVQGSFSDVALLKAIILGIPGVSEERMPVFRDKLSVPEAKDMVALIRSFQHTELASR
jgi:hypothetical protein